MSETIVDVFLGAVLVGRITRVGDTSTFALDPSYVRRADRPVLGRIFEDRLSTSERWIARRNQLPEFFRHYLPEADTRLRRMIAAQHGIKESNELGLLLALGADLPGAMIARGLEPTSFEDSPLELDDPRGSGDGRVQLRFSLAGVQLKFSMVERDGKLMLGGEVDGTAYIVKLYSGQYEGTAENEYSMMQLASDVGIETPRCKLVNASDLALPSSWIASAVRGIAVERYDRGVRGARFHQEDFAQVFDVPASREGKYSLVLPKGRKKLAYESIARVLAAVCDRTDVLEFVRRLAFCIVIGNEDAHLKNWSLLYDASGVRARLSPAYDLVSTMVYDNLDRGLALPLLGEARADRIGIASFERLADLVSIDRATMVSHVRETLERLRDAWRRLEGDLPLHDTHRAFVAARIAAPRWS